MSEKTQIKRALLTPVTGTGGEIEVHFNPVSLQLAITNTLEEKGQDKKQFVTKSVAKLTMDLIFDTTHDGQDVRALTEKVAKFMEPADKKAPAIVSFEWGTYKFQGLVESYKETIDFFSPGGVPLRATINLTLSRQEKVFEPSDTSSKFDTQGALEAEAVQMPTGANQDATRAGALGGNPRAGRSIAAANGLASMRFSAGASLTVSGSVKLGAPVAFASGGAGLSVGGGLSASASAGLSIGAGGGAGLSFGGGAGAGIGASGGIGASAGVGISGGLSIGGAASAGVSASEGAFAGLRASTGSQSSFKLDTTQLIKRSESIGLATDSDASFRVGGQASIEGSTSLSADVGASASLRARIQFE
ncbi:MAG TPA: hypothetical protein VNI02_08035 [Blastocatellia bacterium]|jgi:hypothetical protein|nr:hypothetical protein [Blastocatellia bacterium]